MSLLIDSSLWVDYFRPKTPVKIKQQIAPFINSADAVLCEPIKFEILRASPRRERAGIEALFATFPLLETPLDLWPHAATLGTKCADAGFNPPALDLIIAQVALEYQCELVTFDSHFLEIARVSPLKVQSLKRA